MEYSVRASANALPRGRPILALGRISRRLLTRRRLIVAVLASAVVLGGGWMWFRGSSFTAVEHVQISGLEGEGAGRIEATLEGAARRMGTLDASSSALLAAVASLHLVKAVRIQTSFPHTMRIEVTEQLPVAALTGGDGVRIAVAADGLELPGAVGTGSLPTVAVGGVGTLVAGDTDRQATVRSYLAVLGAEPRQLLKLTKRVYTGVEGLTVTMKDGLEIYFGDDSRPRAKWLSLVSVLADQSSAGSTYVDVRDPERPAAGTGQTSTSAADSENAPADSTASLAVSLEQALRGEAITPEAPAAGETAEVTPEAASDATADTATGEAVGGGESETGQPATEGAEGSVPDESAEAPVAQEESVSSPQD